MPLNGAARQETEVTSVRNEKTRAISPRFSYYEKLFACDGHSLNAQRWTGHCAPPFEVTADLGNVVPHVLEIPGDRDFLDGKGEFAVLDPDAASATLEVSGHEIHAET